MDNITLPNSEPEVPIKRTKVLTILCILSFIGGGLSIFGALVYVVFFDEILNFFASSDSDLYQELFKSLSVLSPSYFLYELLFATTSIVGVIFMWQSRKLGFHIYTISNILILSLPLLFGVGSFNYPNLIIITGPFIVLYFFQLKQMR